MSPKTKRSKRAKPALRFHGPGVPVKFWYGKGPPPDPPAGYNWYYVRHADTGMVRIALCPIQPQYELPQHRSPSKPAG